MRRTTARLTGLLVLSALGGVGCLPAQTTTSRSQAGEDVAETEQLATVGQKTEFGNMEPVPVSSVGFVHNLGGTGSVPVADGWRSQLEVALRRQKFSPKELLDDASLDQSLVLVSALVPPGAREGDSIDIAVSLPAGSKTTSLKNGVLAECELANAELAANARAAMQAQGIAVGKVPAASDDTILTGNRMARAEGRLLAGHETNANEHDGPRAARIWGGGKVLVNRPYYFLLNEANPSPNMALVIAERLNAVFHIAGDPTGKLADAKVKSSQPLVVCGVPPGYRMNHRRFLTVARHVPLTPVTGESPRRRQLADDLLRPETALASAIKLEALGTDSRQPLRVGLESESPWVKFASAESLAYLGFSDGSQELADLAAKHPALRTQCLTALASLDDAICLDKLAEMMKSPDAPLRYGAFVALRSADPTHNAIRGKTINDSFSLHHVAAEASPMVHVATEGRSEIVLFGERFPLRTPFAFPLGKEFTVSAKEGEPTVTVTRILVDQKGEPTPVTRKCLSDIGLILRTVAELGGGFAEAVEFVRRAQTAQVVTNPVLFDAAPRGVGLSQLAAISRTDPTVEKADAEVSRAAMGDIRQAGFDDLPTEGEAVRQATPQPQVDLAREPGRLFGPKRPALPAPEPEPLVK